MPTVIYPNNKVKTVKNLRWLVSHRKQVKHVTLRRTPERNTEARLIASLTINSENVCYICDFATMEVALLWCQQRFIALGGNLFGASLC